MDSDGRIRCYGSHNTRPGHTCDICKGIACDECSPVYEYLGFKSLSKDDVEDHREKCLTQMVELCGHRIDPEDMYYRVSPEGILIGVYWTLSENSLIGDVPSQKVGEHMWHQYFELKPKNDLYNILFGWSKGGMYDG